MDWKTVVVDGILYPGAALELIKHLENIEVPETYAGEFEVELSREDAEGTWFFGDKEISPSSKYVMSSRRGRHSLSVKDVKKEDQGKYTFVCGDLRTSASLKMKCKLAMRRGRVVSITDSLIIVMYFDGVSLV